MPFIRSLLAVSALAACASSAWAQAEPSELVAAAKKEGRVTWYTTAIVDQLVRPVAQAFQAKYGIHVDFVRGDTASLELRIVSEHKAGHPQDDVFDGTTTVAGLEKVGLAAKWVPAAAKNLPKQYVDPNGYWVATNEYVLTPAYNTSLIAPNTAPKSYDDLLSTNLKGKIVWAFTESSSAAPGFIGLTLARLGHDDAMAYLKKLAGQQIASVNSSARQVLNQVISGEYALGLQMFNDQSALSASQGAPVAWVPMSPVMSVLSVAGLNKDAPHPNAGKLLISFLISDEGQTIFQKAKYLTVNPQAPTLDATQKPNGSSFRAIYFTPEKIDAAMPEWVQIYNQLFR